MLNKWIKNNIFEYNPSQKYLDNDSLLGYLVRTNILSKNSPNDNKLRKDFISKILNKQLPSGSWNNSAIRTSLNIEDLLSLNLSKNSRPFKKAVK